ncbi:MAG: alpha/beta hydrolase [Chthonomonadaceae bacterium]|nr:alpha/beta hydrolase [Chthonomonadaceae bacterium]
MPTRPSSLNLLFQVLIMGLVNLTFPNTLVETADAQTNSVVPSRTGLFRSHPRFHSKFLSADRDVLVYLPPNYDKNPKVRYPVLYLHDGQNLFDGSTSYIPGAEWRVDETAQSLITSGKIQPLIIVGIYNAGEKRVAEYTPTQDEKGRGGEADAYGKMLVSELKPFIDREYRTKKDAANTGLGGSSLGGLVSLYLGIKYPAVFGKLAIVSPSVWWDNNIIVQQTLAMPTNMKTKIWLDIGTEEGRQMLSGARLLRDALTSKGWKLNTDLAYFEAVGAQHNEKSWAARVSPLLTFLFPK